MYVVHFSNRIIPAIPCHEHTILKVALLCFRLTRFILRCLLRPMQTSTNSTNPFSISFKNPKTFHFTLGHKPSTMAQPSVPPLIATLYEELGYQPGSPRPVRGFREKTYNWRRLYIERVGRSSQNLLDWHVHHPTFLHMATEFLMDHHHGVKNGEYHWPQRNQIVDGKEVPQYPRDEAS